MKQRLIFFTVAVLVFLCLVNCAKRGTPSGGEPDTDPPKMVKSQPEDFSTNFDKKRIRIYFDEYIKLKDIQKQLIISPPIDQSGYTIFPLGSASKYIDIQILDTLQENTTYSFNFGQSVVDNNENNPYDYFKYVFSTGSYIDSLETNGAIKDALDRSPETFVSVMLYEVDSTYNDSTIFKKPPTYITNTLDSVSDFKLANLKPGKYKLIALKDISNNYVFDPKVDKIGYVEDFVTVPTDTTYLISLFKEVPEFKATRPSQISKQMIAFGYEGIPKDMKIEIVSEVPKDFAYKITKDPEKDSLRYWFKNIQPKTDSLIFKVTKGSYEKEFIAYLKDIDKDSLQVKPNFRGALPLNKDFQIAANTPINSINDSNITILDKDSVAVDFTTKLNAENNSLDVFFEKTESSRYNMTILPKTIMDFYGETNDTIKYTLTTGKKTDFANIILTLKNVKEYPLIAQIINDRKEVIAEKYITENKPTYIFDLIEPQDVYVRVIFDTNKNGKWDTGNYLKNMQPERVSYFPEVQKLRANWDFKVDFILK